MALLDIIILCCFVPAVFIGLKRGLTLQLVSLAVIYFGVKFAIHFSPKLAAWFVNIIPTMPDIWAKCIAFVLIFLVIALILGLVGKLADNIIKISMLGWLNRLLGLLSALIVCAIVMAVLVSLADSLNNTLNFIPKEKLAESRLYPVLLDLSKTLFPRLKELFQSLSA